MDPATGAPPATPPATPPAAPTTVVTPPATPPPADPPATPPVTPPVAAPATPPATPVADPATPTATPDADAAAAAAAKAAEEAAKPKPPDKYELKLPDGSLIDAGYLQRIEAEAKNRGLSQEDAQSLVTSESTAAEGRRNAQADAWEADTRADPEIGGESFNETAELGKRFVEKFASPVLIAELDRWGLGSHPEFVRMCAKAGKAMTEDTLVNGVNINVKKQLSAAQKMYPNQAGDKTGS